ncbi:U6 snRNA phosphodiesterase 1 isoform 1-T2 [Anomaloglossus baeobatrachus]|uniref:U6 snRNA phosphodiesterase 1 n=1 Tax=Anomaloglossus baeobatrachus TaxID=238106 RepID=UPI003F504F40
MVSSPDAEHHDDVGEHGGRLRSFRHERGNWASYVYVAFRPHEELWEMLDELKSVARKHGVHLTTAEEIHVSLSHTVILRHHWIQPFIQSLREKLCTTRRFLCVADLLKVYVNKEKSRTFLGLEVARGRQQLLEVVSGVDLSLQEFHLETFYQNPSFHVSLAWCVGDMAKALQGACLLELQRVVDDFEDSDVLTRFYADTIYCKCGNKVMSIPLC